VQVRLCRGSGAGLATSRQTEVLRWKQHTWRSRAAQLVSLTLILSAVAQMEWLKSQGHDDGVNIILVLLAVGLQSYSRRRWMVEVLRSRPQTQEDKRTYRRLQYVQVVAVLLLSPFIWFLFDPFQSDWHGPLGAVAGASLVGMVIAQQLIIRAYDRLFDRIGKKEGAYGF
jgi:hypothetical protein